MTTAIAVGAAALTALCNGVTAILQKVGADEHERVTSINPRFFVRLTHSTPYLIGVALDFIGWTLTLIAVHSLPLYLVESIIASCVVVTAIIERFVMHRHLNNKSYIAIVIVMLGLVLLALVASPDNSVDVSSRVRLLVTIGPLPLACVAAFLVKSRSKIAVGCIAALSGVSFCGTAIVGRIFIYEAPYWKLLLNPLTWSVVGYGLLGMLLFSIALQRSLAAKINAIMISAQTMTATIFGIIILGDHVRDGYAWAGVIGIIFVITGCAAVALIKTNDTK